MDEMNITHTFFISSSRPQRLFEAVAWSESTIGLLQRNNIFNEATSSRFPQLSIQRTPHDVVTPPPTTPHHPSLYHNDVYSRGSRLRVSGSSGEPPALSLYIYIYTIYYINHGNIYPRITSKHGKHLILQRCEYINKNIREDGICLSGRSYHISYLVL